MSRGIQTVMRTVVVVEFLSAGEILEWKTLEAISLGAALPMSSCHRILDSLVEAGWVQRNPNGSGWRQDTVELIDRGDYAREYLRQLKASWNR
jgi:DNA-binding IclR family transcriptional regulator